jgi:hypothetical protein
MPPQKLTVDDLAVMIARLSQRVDRIRVPPAQVLTQLAPGRRELGFECGYLSLADANASASPVIGITVNNDADFVAVRPMLLQSGPAGAGIPVPPSVTLQIRDSATGHTFYRQPGSALGFLAQPYAPGSPQSSGRFVSNHLGWPAPHVLKRASSVFFEISNPTGYVFVGDLYLVYEGYRLYSNEKEPVPDTITGQVEPFDWNGTLVVPNGLSAGLQIIGTITMPGTDQDRYVLKAAAINATGVPSAVGGVTLFPEDVLLMQVKDTYQQNKQWARVSTPPPYGQYMPAKAFVGGGPGAPWAWPRFVQGTDTIYIDLVTDPSAWVGGNPGTIEFHLIGDRIYG